MQLPTDFENGSHVLNQLFAAQSMLHIFPNARRMGEFAVQALKIIPSVNFGSCCLRGEMIPIGDVSEASLKLSATLADYPNKLPPNILLSPDEETQIVLPLLTVDYFFGYVLLSITNKKDFGFFEPAISNFVNVLAIHLENVEYQSQVKSYQDELQSKIDERTEELRAEIDQRKLFEHSLQVQKNEFEAIFELVPAQIWYKDTLNRFIRVNRQVCQDIGMTKSEIEGHSAEELFPAFAKNFFDDDNQVFNSRQPKLGISEQINTSSGEIRWLHTDKMPVFGDDGEVNGLIAFVNDITEQKKFEEALRASEQNYREIFNATTEAIFIHDAQTGAILDVNDAMIAIYGYNSKEEVLSGNIGSLSANEGPYTERRAQEYINKTLEEGPQTFEWLARKKDGTVFWIEIILKKTEIGGKNRILAVGRDISERKKTEEELGKKQRFIESIIENSPIGFALNTIDDGNGVYVGSKFEEIYGVAHSSLNSVNDYFEKVFIDPGYREQMRERIMGDIMSMDASRMKWDNIPITTKSGEKRIVNIANIPLFEQNFMISTVQDVTERMLHEEGIIKAKKKAEESDRLKSALLNNMNHEIRTPMNAIMGFSDLMAEAEGDEKNQYAAIIKQSSNQLLTLIDDMIQLSRLQSERIPLNNVKFNPAKLVAEVSQMFNLPEVRNGLEIVINIPDQYKELVILSDADKIRQVMTNFVSNALKYTKEGSVELGFDLKDDLIEFFVKDTGIGVPMLEQERIFESFYRGKQALSSAIRGTGLGLSITKELVNLLNGTIGLNSEPNKGSRFYFTIPFVASETETLGKPSANSNLPLLDRSILIVDDEFINYQYLEILLKKRVKQIDHATNGKEAVEMAQKNSYNLILMDMKMPVMGGIEATKILKQQFPELPIIAQTAFSLPEEKTSALQAGCDDFLSKPIRKEELMEMISKYAQ